MVSFFSRRFNEIDVEPFHQFVGDGRAFETNVRHVQGREEGKAGAEAAIVVGAELMTFTQVDRFLGSR